MVEESKRPAAGSQRLLLAAKNALQSLFFIGRKRLWAGVGSASCGRSAGDDRARQPNASGQNQRRSQPKQKRVPAERRLEQHEFPIAANDKVEDFVIRFTLLQPFADEQAQIAGQRRIAVIYRLVLADEAA